MNAELRELVDTLLSTFRRRGAYLYVRTTDGAWVEVDEDTKYAVDNLRDVVEEEER